MADNTTISTETPAWQACALATLMRDALALYGGDDAGTLVLTEEQSEVLMVGLHRLAELTQSVARSSC